MMKRSEIEGFVRRTMRDVGAVYSEAEDNVVDQIADRWEEDRQDARDEKEDPCMGPCCGGDM
jgi:hypothetical protein